MPVKHERARAAHLGPTRRRPLVLDAALPLFVDRGFAATSMEAIAAAAGVTKPVVYGCFPDKRALFRALLEREEGRLLEALGAALPAAFDLDDTERLLVDGFTALLSAVAAQPSSWRIVWLSEASGDPDVAERLAAGRRMVIARAAEMARVLLEGRGTRDVDRRAHVVGELMLGLGEAGVRVMLDSPEEWSADDLGAYIGRLVARGQSAM